MNSVNLDKYSDPFFLGETKEELRRIRQDFHVHPEIGLVTPRTSRIIADLLKDYGVDEVHEGVGGDGVVGVIYGKLPGEASVGLRADIDALPLKELSNHDHVSQVEGAMHACGHDGHAAALLGAAKKLASERNFGGKVVLVFQPGEEGWSGAKHMMEDGLFERFPMQEIYAFHNSSAIEPGRIALNYGAMQAAADAFTIVVKGKGGHASRPNLNHDPVIAAAHIILALQTIVSREVDPLETAVVSCCSLQAGDPRAQSVCPDSCQIVGTARTFSPEVRDLVEKRIGEISAVVVRYYGGILLGTGGLVRAYGNGVQQALKLLETERKVERQLFQVHCDYAQLNWIQILCEQHKIEIYQQDFQVQITLQLGISEDQIKPFEQALIERSAGTLKLEEMN